MVKTHKTNTDSSQEDIDQSIRSVPHEIYNFYEGYTASNNTYGTNYGNYKSGYNNYDNVGQGGVPFKSMNKAEKPSLSYAALIAEAITNSNDNRLTLRDIYKVISHKYPYYSLNASGWQNSIRHNLSLNKAFIKFPKTENCMGGKGSFWTIVPEEAHHIINRSRKNNRTSIYRRSGYEIGYPESQYQYNYKNVDIINPYNKSFSKIEVSKDEKVSGSAPPKRFVEEDYEYFTQNSTNHFFKFD